jgi:hypothetical protein
MIQYASSSKAAEMLFEASQDLRDRTVARREELIAILIDLLESEFLMRKNPEIGFVSAEFLPSLVTT